MPTYKILVAEHRAVTYFVEAANADEVQELWNEGLVEGHPDSDDVISNDIVDIIED